MRNRRTRGQGKFAGKGPGRRGGDNQSRPPKAVGTLSPGSRHFASGRARPDPLKRWEIHRHPASCIPAAWRLDVRLTWTADASLRLDYRLRLPRKALAIPAPGIPGRRDGLWRHSCCEAFIAVVGETAYREYNFSPAGDWAVYDFSDYRIPLTPPEVQADTAPRIDFGRQRHEWRLVAHLPRQLLPSGQPGTPLALVVTVVLEDRAGRLSYWALAHGDGQPDFHRLEAPIQTLVPPIARSLP